MKQLYQHIIRLMPYFFWSSVAIVTVIMLIESAPKEDAWQYWDKVQHASIFLILCLAGCLAFKRHKGLIIIGLSVFGAVTEVLQETLTTTRTGDVFDWLADIVGIFICLLILPFLRRMKPKRLQ
jgi:VanZ family protein